MGSRTSAYDVLDVGCSAHLTSLWLSGCSRSFLGFDPADVGCHPVIGNAPSTDVASTGSHPRRRGRGPLRARRPSLGRGQSGSLGRHHSRSKRHVTEMAPVMWKPMSTPWSIENSAWTRRRQSRQCDVFLRESDRKERRSMTAWITMIDDSKASPELRATLERPAAPPVGWTMSCVSIRCGRTHDGPLGALHERPAQRWKRAPHVVSGGDRLLGQHSQPLRLFPRQPLRHARHLIADDERADTILAALRSGRPETAFETAHLAMLRYAEN